VDDATDEVSTVEATRMQIEETRGEMSETVNAIRDKLNTQTLAEQAKETVSDITADVMEKARTTVHNVVEDAKSTVHDVMQEAKETLPKLTSNVAHQAVSGAVTEAKEAVGSAVSTARHAMGGAADSARDAGATVMDFIRHNPIPAALIAIGAGWLWANNRNQRFPTRRFDYAEERYGRRDWSESAGLYGERDWAVSGQEGRSPSPLTSGTQRSGVGDTLGRAQESVQRAAGQVQERVSQTAGHVQEAVGSAAGRVQETVGHLGERAGAQARGMADGFQRSLEERPLAVGAMMLGLGALVGMLVPGTYREDRLMGEARDQVVDSVKGTAQDLAMRAQIIAEEAIDTASEEARNQGLAR
jgi:hypothetical protein